MLVYTENRGHTNAGSHGRRRSVGHRSSSSASTDAEADTVGTRISQVKGLQIASTRNNV